jgi:hypothetical protein
MCTSASSQTSPSPGAQHGGDGQPAAERIARDGDVPGVGALAEQPPVGGGRVVQRRGMGQWTVFREQCAGSGGLG